MLKSIKLSIAAVSHLTELRSHYHDLGGVNLVTRLEDDIEAVFLRLATFPESYVVWANDIRRALTKRFPLALYYRVHDTQVEILSITDQRRDPHRLKF